ncbi:MAG TPA: hypothetical protein VNO43_12925, partial [Candidatus Eisenbacteria bacterium]|nr:hypothetical protein [Candidatus Eisenbacteria bacterium]
DTPLLIRDLEFAANLTLGEPEIEAILDRVDQQISPSSDFRGSEWYKRRIARVLVRRALAQVQQRV